MKKPMDTSSWFGKWTQINDRDGKKVVVFLPEDQTGLQDKRTDFGQLIQVEDLILSGRLNDDIRQKAEESDRNPESVEPGNGRDEAGAGASPSVSSVTSKVPQETLQMRKSNDISEALKKSVAHLAFELKRDPDYRRSWSANIAMAFKDAYARESRVVNGGLVDMHTVANQAAEDFLNLLCTDSVSVPAQTDNQQTQFNCHVCFAPSCEHALRANQQGIKATNQVYELRAKLSLAWSSFQDIVMRLNATDQSDPVLIACNNIAVDAQTRIKPLLEETETTPADTLLERAKAFLNADSLLGR